MKALTTMFLILVSISASAESFDEYKARMEAEFDSYKSGTTIETVAPPKATKPAAKEETKKPTFNNAAEYTQYIIDELKAMDEFDRTFAWLDIQEEREGEIPMRTLSTIAGEVFGYESSEYQDIELRREHGIPFGTSYRIYCEDNECTLELTR
tara:strand:+ start:525 stop:983 length:459 start_codon:yes stop_codon:yes gene_type:complete